MLNSRTDNLRLIKIGGILFLIIIISAFTIFRSLNYARGPQITIFYPTNGSMTASSTLKIGGQAQRINKITLNGNPISIDEKGFWEENIIIFSGINLITIKAEDQFGRKISKQLDIVGKTNQ